MRKHRTEDHRLIVVVNRLVDFHRDLHLKTATGQFADGGSGDGADVAEHLGVVPLVIVKHHVRVLAAAFIERDLQPFTNRLLAHGVMRAERNHHIQLGRTRANLRMNGLEELAHRGGARVVRYNQQHLLAGVFGCWQCLAHK